MNHEPNDDDLRELLALAAVDALDADEQAALDHDLAGRADLRAELETLREAAATIAAATAEAPPPAMRANVLAAIADEPQLARAAPVATTPPTGVADNVVPMRAPRRRRWTAAIGAVAAVAAAIVAFLVIAPGSGSDPVDVAAVVDADDRVTVPLDGELSGMELVHSPALGASALVGSAIPTPGDDDVYELWMISDAEPEPVDTFRPDEDGDVELLIEDATSPDDVVFAVTIEPPGGSEQPTTPILAASS